MPETIPVRRIAMWSGPRNISTAMMRAFENRPDCVVVDEPFYAAYLSATGLDHPGRDDVLASQPQDWRTVAKSLCEMDAAPVVYQKHMTQHLLPHMDLRFTARLTNCFLIREPRRIIASYARVRDDFDLRELGFHQQRELFRRECDRLGAAPPVLDAALTLKQPKAMLSQLCDYLDLPFTDAMLKWPAGPRSSDGIWAPHWYASVWSSTGFATPDQNPQSELPANTLSAKHEAMRQEADEIYREMYRYAISGCS